MNFPDSIERLLLKVSADRARLLSEQERRAQQARLILDSIPAFVIVLTPTGEIEDANTQTLRYLGKTLTELKEWSTIGIIHPDDLPRTSHIFRRSIAAGDAYNVEQRLRNSEGHYRWFRASGIPVSAENARIGSWYVVLIDIDDIKQAEEHFQERERQTRAIVESIPAYIAVFSPNGEIEFLNAPLLQYWGTSRDKMTDQTVHDMVHPEDLAVTAQAFANALRTGDACDIESRLRRFDGAYRWFNSRGLPLRDAHGAIVRWYFVFLDVDDRRRAQEDLSERERQLRRSEAFVSEGQRLSQTGTFYWNTATNELRFSEENYRTNEIEPGTPLTMELMASRIHPDDQALLQEKIEAGQNDRGGLDYEIRLKVPSGKVKWVHTISRRYQDEDGTQAYIGAVQDVTERHHAEEALSKLRSELTHLARVSSLGALTASIAHEVNQPLAGITTNASTGLLMLSAQPPNVRGALETVRRTIRDANRAAEVIARLREMFSRKETVSEELHLNEAAREVVALSLTELQRNGITVQTQYARELPIIYGDRVQLQQVILNLLLNAADAMKGIAGRAREILLKTELQDESAVQLTVVDSGTGIDPALAEKLFEPFFTTKETGMGIGLSVCRSIIERHHGRLWAQPNEGHGTSFSFSVPLRKG